MQKNFTVLLSGFLLGLTTILCLGFQSGGQICNFTTAQCDFLKELANKGSFVDLPDGQGGMHRTLRLSSINVQIVNGQGLTTVKNGLGNLIVGYNEMTGVNPNGDDRTGSHNVVLGMENSYSKTGGFLSGERNSVFVDHASAIGGFKNLASGSRAVVVSGVSNMAGIVNSAIVAGALNSVIGAGANEAAILGGQSNVIDGGFRAAIMAGDSNAIVNSSFGSITGGSGNRIGVQGTLGTITGGANNIVNGAKAVVLGGVGNSANGLHSTVSGGEGNTATGLHSSVSGGNARTASGTHDWVAGSLFQDN